MYLYRHFDLSRASFVGASAGSLTASLAACEVDMNRAAESALKLCMAYGVWERPLGLAGIWGPLVRSWLHTCLPPDAAERCGSRVSAI
jgi:hypothetical protein